MERRRTKFEIVNYLLGEIKRRKTLGITKTRLMQEANLAYYLFFKYLKQLVSGNLINCNKKITITDSGEDYLKKSNLILLKQEKLNKLYSIDFDKIGETRAEKEAYNHAKGSSK